MSRRPRPASPPPDTDSSGDEEDEKAIVMQPAQRRAVGSGSVPVAVPVQPTLVATTDPSFVWDTQISTAEPRLRRTLFSILQNQSTVDGIARKLLETESYLTGTLVAESVLVNPHVPWYKLDVLPVDVRALVRILYWWVPDTHFDDITSYVGALALPQPGVRISSPRIVRFQLHGLLTINVLSIPSRIDAFMGSFPLMQQCIAWNGRVVMNMAPFTESLRELRVKNASLAVMFPSMWLVFDDHINVWEALGARWNPRPFTIGEDVYQALNALFPRLDGNALTLLESSTQQLGSLLAPRGYRLRRRLWYENHVNNVLTFQTELSPERALVSIERPDGGTTGFFPVWTRPDQSVPLSIAVPEDPPQGRRPRVNLRPRLPPPQRDSPPGTLLPPLHQDARLYPADVEFPTQPISHPMCADILGGDEHKLEEWLNESEDNIVILDEPRENARWGTQAICYSRAAISRYANTRSFVHVECENGVPNQSKRYVLIAMPHNVYIPMADCSYIVHALHVRVFQLQAPHYQVSSAVSLGALDGGAECRDSSIAVSRVRGIIRAR